MLEPLIRGALYGDVINIIFMEIYELWKYGLAIPILFLLSQLNLTKTKFVSADVEAGHSRPFPHHHPYMEADQGEEDERIMERMEADDAEHLAFVDEFAGRSFDDETYIPKDWAHIAPDTTTGDDDHHSSWEYSMIEVKQGQMFHDKVHLQHVVRLWAFLKRSSLRWLFLTPRRGT